MKKKLVLLAAISLSSIQLIHAGLSPFDDNFTPGDYEDFFKDVRDLLQKYGLIASPTPTPTTPTTPTRPPLS